MDHSFTKKADTSNPLMVVCICYSYVICTLCMGA